MPGLVLKLGSIDEQRELFLWKFADISRTAVIDLEKVCFIIMYISILYKQTH